MARRAAGVWWDALKSLLRRRDAPIYLSDGSAFDFNEDPGDEPPRFSELRVVVEPAPRGALSSDDDSLLDRDVQPSPGARTESCERCAEYRELSKQRRVSRRLWLAAALYLVFMVGELVGGYAANSLAIVTDALHMLTDLTAILLTLLALWLSTKSPNKRFTFGFHRLEVLSAIISVLLVYILTAFLLYEAVQRTIHMDYEINGDIMLITAAVGVAVNLIMGLLLSQTGHTHSHSPSSEGTSHLNPGHGHGHTSLAVRAAFIHALGDLVQSVGVLIAAYIIRFKPEYKIADPICTYIFSFLVVFTTVRIMRDTILIILEGVPRHLNVDHIKEDLMKLQDVQSVDDLNVWSLTTGKTSAIIHLQLVSGSSSKWEEVQYKARHTLLNKYGMHRCSVQLRSYKEEERKSCTNCQLSPA